MVTLRGGVITGLEPGITSLRIAPVNFGSPPGSRTSQSQITASVILDISTPSLRTTVTRPPVSIDSMVPTELVRHLLGGARLVVGQPIALLDANMLRGGYVQGSRYGRGGDASIVSFPFTRLTSPISIYCRNLELVSVGITEARGTETVVSVSRQPGQRTVCDPEIMRAQADRGSNPAMNLIPSLAPIPGAITTGGGSGGGGDESYADARIMTDIAVTEIAEHYRRQLLAAGWKDAERTSTSSVAVTTFTMRDSTARQWSGVLTVIGNPPSNRIGVRLMLQLMPDGQ